MRPRKTDLELPKCVYFRSGTYYYVKDGKWNSIGKEINDAVMRKAINKFGNAKDNNTSRIMCEEYLIKKAAAQKSRASSVGRVWELSSDEILKMLHEQHFRCKLTDIPFNLEQRVGMKTKPFAPSIDRIDNSVGYVIDNCRLVLNCVNIARNTMDDALLIMIGVGLAKTISHGSIGSNLI